MGIIKASVTAIRGAAADQWKEMFCAGEMGSDVLMVRARKLTSQNGANQGFGEVITDGSIIVVGEGECAVATEGGKVIGIYDQPGEDEGTRGRFSCPLPRGRNAITCCDKTHGISGKMMFSEHSVKRSHSVS